MKKNYLLFALVLCLVVMLVVAMAACNLTDTIKDLASNANTDDGDGDDNGGGDNGDSSSFDYDSAAAVNALKTLQQSNGYLIRYSISESATSETNAISVGAKGNVYYVADDSQQIYYDVSGNNGMVCYSKNNTDTDWVRTDLPYSEYYTKEDAYEAMQSTIQLYSVWLTYYQSFVSSMKDATKTSATVAGRACDKYTFYAAALTGSGLDMARAYYECYVDRSTSVCLKWHYSIAAEGTTENWTMECVEFNTNPTLTLPDVGDQGSTSGSNNGGAQNDGNVYTITLPTRENILAAIGDTYKAVAKGLYDNYPTTVAADGLYYYTTAPYERLYKKIAFNGNDTYIYPYSYSWDGKYHRIGTPEYTQDGVAPTMLGRGLVGNMLQFAGEELSYNTVTSVTFIGRSAKKYVFDSTNAYGYNLQYHEEVIIDDLTGACLYYENEGRAGDGFTGSTRNKAAFEVTKFSYGANDSATRALLDSYIAKIDVFEWETDFLESIGLANVNAPQADFWYGEWNDSDNNSRDSEAPDWNVQYKLFSDTQEEYQDYIRDFCLSFYNAGAKIDYGTHQAEFDDLYAPNGGWDDVNMTAYVVGNPSYIVYISAHYVTYTSSNYWQIEVEVMLEE